MSLVNIRSISTLIVNDIKSKNYYNNKLIDNSKYKWHIITWDQAKVMNWSNFDISKLKYDNNNNNNNNNLWGNTIVYTPTVGSTQDMVQFFRTMDDLRPVIIVTDQQTAGVGRRSNTWISPTGCLMLSLRYHINNIKLLPFLQYFISLCVLKAVKSIDERVPLNLKWPNDLWGKQKKAGGVLCKIDNCIEAKGAFEATIGIGLNVTNTEPIDSTNINKLLKEVDKNAPTITREMVFSALMKTFNECMPIFEKDLFEPFLQDYYNHWMHQNQVITLQDGPMVTIQGLSSNGYLQAKTKHGDLVELHPAYDSLNFLESLAIRRKL